MVFFKFYEISFLVDGAWGDWDPYGDCDSSTGIKIRTRLCDSPEQKNGGEACPGSPVESEDCPGKNCYLSTSLNFYC